MANTLNTSSEPAEHTYDPLLLKLAEYASSVAAPTGATLHTAGLCLADSVGCAIASLRDPECTQRLGPWVPGSAVADGVPVWATGHVLDPVKAAHDLSVMIRWLDFSDTTFVGGHPSDNLGALLAAGDYLSRWRVRSGGPALIMADIYAAMIGAYEIQGLLAADNRFDHPSIGLDHVIGVKLASTAMAARLLGADANTIAAALSSAFLDGHSLNACRHTPNAGSRKGWAGADAASRGVWLALSAVRGEMGYPKALSAPTWGFEAVYLEGKRVELTRPLGSLILDNVIFKLHPCQRNTTTAVESALRLHEWLSGRLSNIKRVTIHTHDEAMRRANKTGPLPNRAARDHSIQYVVAVALLHGRLMPDDYSDTVANDDRIDWLRERTVVIENQGYTRDHHDMAVKSCANAVQIELEDGTISVLEETLFPAGDPSRRDVAVPALKAKFHTLTSYFWQEPHRSQLLARLLDVSTMAKMPVPTFMDMLRLDVTHQHQTQVEGHEGRRL
ncbi:2-methylcitrate dehydratase [Ottowia thiooxydans]|uniref:2-methylcitrate dehydratase n=1 Tax=Ottowia thiooxydans TaxID=219182 RepID=UPI00146B2AB7|nr:2-methylcitrate dehydratase [Ottowia thiooxydans]